MSAEPIPHETTATTTSAPPRPAAVCRLRRLEGTPVILLANGSSQGVVERAFFRDRDGSLVGLTVRRPGGFLSKGDLLLLRAANIHSIGQDAVTVARPEALERNDYAEKELTAEAGEEALGKKVVTVSGRILGAVQDVLFDPNSGQIYALEVSGGMWQNLARGRADITRHNIVSVGHDVVVVQDLPGGS